LVEIAKIRSKRNRLFGPRYEEANRTIGRHLEIHIHQAIAEGDKGR
jgi:hypothetical protein